MNFATIRDALAKPILTLSKLRGMQVTYVNGTYPVESGVSVYVLCESSGLDNGTEDLGYRVARQTSFPPSEFIADGRLLISGTESLWIQSVQPDNERCDMASSFLLVCSKSADGNFN